MASEAATREKTATATVLRATERQIRLRLGKAHGDREVTKRVPVPAELRDQLEGAKVPVVITGTGDKAKVELADDWAAKVAAKAPAKKAAPATEKPAAKKPAARTSATKRAAAAPAANDATPEPTDDAPTEKPRRRTRSRAAQTTESAPAAKAEAATPTDDAPAEKPRRRGRSRAKQSVETAAPAPSAVPAVAPAVIAERIAAAVELVRGARR